MFKRKAKAKAKPYVVEPFDDGGEIQVVPIDTVVGDGGYNLAEEDGGKNPAQGVRGKCIPHSAGCVSTPPLTRTLPV